MTGNLHLLPGDVAIDMPECIYADFGIPVQGPLGDGACRQSLASYASKQRMITSLEEPQAPKL